MLLQTDSIMLVLYYVYSNCTNAIIEILKQGPLLILCIFTFLQKKFRYKEGVDQDYCRDVLEAIAAKRYREELHEARDYCFKKWKHNKQAWKEYIPHWCLDHPYWQSLCDIFFTEDWQNMSRKNHSNRTKSKLLVANHCGSASSHQHFGKLVSFIIKYYVPKP